MRDYPPEEKILRDELVSLLKEIFERYGFNPLETPVVERWEVLAAKYGGGEEILKETFRLRDQGGRELGLRYEMTTSLARFVAMNPTRKRPLKLYQIGPVFRDGPIKRGRLRQFWQCDVDIIGAEPPLADAELINLTMDVFKSLNLDVVIKINNRQLLKDFIEAAYIEPGKADAVILSLDKIEKIGRDNVIKELIEKGVTLDQANWLLDVVSVQGSNDERFSAIRERLPSFWGAGLEELEMLFNFIMDRKKVIFEPSLARGLAYYTGTIFEVYPADPKYDFSIAAGGRYDKMIGKFLEQSEDIPAVGISFGLESISEVMMAKAARGKLPKSRTKVFVIPIATFKPLYLSKTVGQVENQFMRVSRTISRTNKPGILQVRLEVQPKVDFHIVWISDENVKFIENEPFTRWENLKEKKIYTHSYKIRWSKSIDSLEIKGSVRGIPSDSLINKIVSIVQKLRNDGINTDMDLLERGVSANLSYANAYGIPYVLLIGPDELNQGKVKLRDMESGEEELLTVEEVVTKLG